MGVEVRELQVLFFLPLLFSEKVRVIRRLRERVVSNSKKERPAIRERENTVIRKWEQLTAKMMHIVWDCLKSPWQRATSSKR